MIVALGIALLLNRKGIRGIGIFRTIFYLPVVIPGVAAGILFLFLLNPANGLLNQALGLVGIEGPGWFYDPAWAKNGIILLTVWAAGDVVIIYLGALQGVSRSLYEAAEVDGAGAWVKLRHVTIPMISPAILFNLITGAIASFQRFTEAYVVGSGVGRGNDGSIGGVQNSLLLYGLNLVQQRVPLLPDGLRVGARLDPAHHHPDRHGPAPAGVEESGLLRERTMSAIAAPRAAGSPVPAPTLVVDACPASPPWSCSSSLRRCTWPRSSG